MNQTNEQTMAVRDDATGRLVDTAPCLAPGLMQGPASDDEVAAPHPTGE